MIKQLQSAAASVHCNIVRWAAILALLACDLLVNTVHRSLFVAAVLALQTSLDALAEQLVWVCNQSAATAQIDST
jgi:hypothetical protein